MPSSDPCPPGASVVVDPLQYPEWDSLLAVHPGVRLPWQRLGEGASQQTYGHRPVYICRFEGRQLVGLLPIMEVSSPWTGLRGASLPFTDFCPALNTGNQDGRVAV